MIFSKAELEAASSEQDMYDLAGAYSQASLGHESYPESSVDFLVSLIGMPEVSSKKYFDAFLSSALHEAFLMTEDQKSKIYFALLSGYRNMRRQNVCWLVCDFIARTYSADEALDFFRKSSNGASKVQMEGVALGVDIVLRDKNLLEQTRADLVEIVGTRK